jgi:hypothetical protein
MNSKNLFSWLSEGDWTSADPARHALTRFTDSSFEYLLRFCEINRTDFIGRLNRGESELPVETIMYRVLLALHWKWCSDRDYRYLNIITKFMANKYTNYLPKGAASSALIGQLKSAMEQELS